MKPANLVRPPNGRVVLVDFDIAGAHAGKGRLGTVGYVAPEVAAGEKPTPAADVFGLAATAVTLLNGEPPPSAAPTYPGVDPDRAGTARPRPPRRALDRSRPSTALRRPGSSRTCAARGRSDHPSGVVALLATEVADAARLWEDDPDEMRVAMAASATSGTTSSSTAVGGSSRR